MSQLINFANYQPTENNPTRDYLKGDNEQMPLADSFISTDSSASRAETISLLLKISPAKINYTQQEAAKVLNMSYQFVNRKCKAGLIKVSSYGDKQLININELARIILEGVNNVNKKTT